MLSAGLPCLAQFVGRSARPHAVCSGEATKAVGGGDGLRGREASNQTAQTSGRIAGVQRVVASAFRKRPLISGPESASKLEVGFVLPERSPPVEELLSHLARQAVVLGSLSIVSTLPALVKDGKWHRAVWAQLFDSVYESACSATGEPSDICSIAAGFYHIENDVERAERLYEVAVQQEQEREKRRQQELARAGGGAGAGGVQCASALATYAHFLFLTEGKEQFR